MDTARAAGDKFAELVAILSTLRGKEGCPWDREQDERTILNYFLEEVYEAIDALLEENSEALCEELGDVLMEVVFLAQIQAEKGAFSILESLDRITRKMVARHPHVYGRERHVTSDQVLEAWQRRKQKEKGRNGLLEGLPRHLPALLAAFQMGHRVAAVGFDWPSPEEALKKVKEEVGELEKAMARGQRAGIGEEAGDLFFALANLSRLLGFNPEVLCGRANAKFARRFERLEEKFKEHGRSLAGSSPAELDQVWEEVKKRG